MNYFFYNHLTTISLANGFTVSTEFHSTFRLSEEKNKLNVQINRMYLEGVLCATDISNLPFGFGHVCRINTS